MAKIERRTEIKFRKGPPLASLRARPRARVRVRARTNKNGNYVCVPFRFNVVMLEMRAIQERWRANQIFHHIYVYIAHNFKSVISPIEINITYYVQVPHIHTICATCIFYFYCYCSFSPLYFRFLFFVLLLLLLRRL